MSHAVMGIQVLRQMSRVRLAEHGQLLVVVLVRLLMKYV